MPHEFVKRRVGASDLAEAVRQQEQLSYFTESVIQEEVTQEYINAWSERKYNTNDMFLNYVKSVFRTDNALAFFKFLRNPIASAELINDRIVEPLARVFHSDDSFFKYNIRGETFQSIEELNSKKFDKDIFNALLFRHNNIIVTLVEDTNTPVRQIIDIKNVVAIKSRDSVIHKIAYTAVFHNELGEHVKGFMFIDEFQYAFLNDKFEVVKVVPHDLGQTPADFIAEDPFSDKDSVRKSMFSYVRSAMEEYVFLKTLLKMTEPNGVIPVITMVDAKINRGGKDTKGQKEGEPATSNTMGSQQAEFTSEITASTNLVQAGTIIKAKARLKDDGSVDTDSIQNYFKFHHMPVEPLKYVNDRILEIKKDIIVSILGNFSEQNEAAKNQLQVDMSFVNKKDTLRSLSVELSRIRNLSDFKFLALQHGKDNVRVECFYGSDFFTETTEQLYKRLNDSPNPIERDALLRQLSRNRNQFNPMQRDREEILNHLLPYSFDEDFTIAIEQGKVDPNLFQYQNRFNYWIGLFEAQFGDIVIFWESLEGSNSEKLIVINNLITNMIAATNKEVVVDDVSAAKNAQAALRGSVGGVTGIVAMLTGGLEEGPIVEILVSLYGLDKSVAEAIAKRETEPKIINTNSKFNN